MSLKRCDKCNKLIVNNDTCKYCCNNVNDNYIDRIKKVLCNKDKDGFKKMMKKGLKICGFITFIFTLNVLIVLFMSCLLVFSQGKDKYDYYLNYQKSLIYKKEYLLQILYDEEKITLEQYNNRKELLDGILDEIDLLRDKYSNFKINNKDLSVDLIDNYLKDYIYINSVMVDNYTYVVYDGEYLQSQGVNTSGLYSFKQDDKTYYVVVYLDKSGNDKQFYNYINLNEEKLFLSYLYDGSAKYDEEFANKYQDEFDRLKKLYYYSVNMEEFKENDKYLEEKIRYKRYKFDINCLSSKKKCI